MPYAGLKQIQVTSTMDLVLPDGTPVRIGAKPPGAATPVDREVELVFRDGTSLLIFPARPLQAATAEAAAPPPKGPLTGHRGRQPSPLRTLLRKEMDRDQRAGGLRPPVDYIAWVLQQKPEWPPQTRIKNADELVRKELAQRAGLRAGGKKQ